MMSFGVVKFDVIAVIICNCILEFTVAVSLNLSVNSTTTSSSFLTVRCLGQEDGKPELEYMGSRYNCYDELDLSNCLELGLFQEDRLICEDCCRNAVRDHPTTTELTKESPTKPITTTDEKTTPRLERHILNKDEDKLSDGSIALIAAAAAIFILCISLVALYKFWYLKKQYLSRNKNAFFPGDPKNYVGIPPPIIGRDVEIFLL